MYALYALYALPPSPASRSASLFSKKSFRAIAVVLVIFSATLATPALARHRRVAVDKDVTKDGQPNVKSTTALVIDLADSSVIYQKDPDVVRPLASLSKMMSALVIHEECKMNWDDLHEMTSSNRDAAKGGDKTRLTTGWQFSHRDLLYAALMRSDNRALPALGEACGWTPEELGKKMTDRARRMGLTKTNFKEPTGLSQENVSTAREVLAILREVLKIPEITTIMETQEYEITGHKNGLARKIRIRNTDRMLGKGIAEIIGGKTGYTDPARYCLAIAARTAEKRDIAMVFLGAEGKYTRFADFTRVVKWVRVKDAVNVQNVAGSTVGNLEIAEGYVSRAKAAGQAVVKVVSKAASPEARAAPAEAAETPAAAAAAAPESGSGPVPDDDEGDKPLPETASGEQPKTTTRQGEDGSVRTMTW